MRADVVATRAPGTWAHSYTALAARYIRFCRDRVPPRNPCPAEPMTVCLFLQLVADAARTYSVVKSASGMIFSLHEMAMVPKERNPTKCEMAKSIRQAAKRRLGTRLVNQKDPLPLAVLLSAVTANLGAGMESAPLVFLSWAAMVMTMWTGLLRWKDMSLVFVDCVSFYDTHMEIFLAYRKNDQFRRGDVVFVSRGQYPSTCPVRLCQTLIRRAGLRGHVPLFQGWDGRRLRRRSEAAALPLSGSTVSYAQCRTAFFAMVAKATGQKAAQVTSQFGTQSCRSGGATVLAPQIDFRRFQQHGAWHTAEAAHRYIRDSTEDRVQVTALLGY